MADCDLCSVSLPTLNPVKVVMPRFASAFPKGTWVGLCDKCLESANEVNINTSSLGSANGKCDLCGAQTELYPVDVEFPSLWKGVDPDVAILCKKCLKGCTEAKVRKENEPKSEHH
ncbi:MAG: F420H2 dehydrogenase subunit FpoO [Methanosarcinaceae archaeon]|nr:F420H2 dehydrogenase subunit FpoO [Methanosarcinaceae archaeon]